MKKNMPVAFLWDESFLWGIMAYKALTANNLPFELIRSKDIKNGCLKDYRMLFVPGGWASNKLKALGDDGIERIKEFVRSGGNYFGICGGAGLATMDGIGLVNIKRKPTKERVPSFSGRIYLNIKEHPIFLSLQHQAPSAFIFHAWWPSQFLVDDRDIKILATYGDALPDSFSSDLNVADVQSNSGWSEIERIYKINLDPKRLKNEPAVVEANFGKGKVVLSLIHFDTPDDKNGATVLRNLWKYLNPNNDTQKNLRFSEGPNSHKGQVTMDKLKNKDNIDSKNSLLIKELESAVDDLISFGIRNFLWFWRNPMLLQWRRGVRGLEYCTLYIMIKEIANIVRSQGAPGPQKICDTVTPEGGPQKVKDFLGSWFRSQKLEKTLIKIRELLIPFIDKAKHLLILERYAMQNGHITYEKCDNPEIQKIRIKLFSNSKSHGGLFKKLIDEIDNLLYSLIK